MPQDWDWQQQPRPDGRGGGTAYPPTDWAASGNGRNGHGQVAGQRPGPGAGDGRPGRGAPRDPVGVRDRRSAADPRTGRRRSGSGAGPGPGSGAGVPEGRREPAWDAPHQPQRMRGRRGPDDPNGPGGPGRGGRRPGPGPNGPGRRGPGTIDEDDEQSKPRRSWRQRMVLGLGIALVLAMFAGAGVAWYVWDKYSSIDRFGEDLTTDVAAAGEPENFLLIGSDQRESETARSDTIMILRIDPESGQAQALSFQRDLMVEIAGTGREDKINSSFNNGAPGVVDTIRQNFGIPIHHVVQIDFEGFRRLVDQVGGVELWIDAAVRDEDAGLFVEQLGCVNLGGDQALAFARSRKLEFMTEDGWEYDVTSDHGRVLRQQILIRQALSKAVNQARSNPTDVLGMLDIVSDTVTLSEGLGIDKLRELAGQLQNFSADGLTPYAMPIIEVGDAGSADLYPNWDAADPILNVFRGLPANEVSPRRVTVEVQNGSGEPEQAVNVAGALDTIGFEVSDATDAPAPLEATTIYHAPGEEAYANRVARHLDSGAELVVDESLETGHVRLVTGSDFTRLHEEPTPLEENAPAAPAGTTAPSEDGATSETTAATTATTAAPAGGEGEGGTTSTTLPPPPERIGHAVGEPPPGQECG